MSETHASRMAAGIAAAKADGRDWPTLTADERAAYARGDERADAGELTYQHVPHLRVGERLHWTNWPGIPSIPVRVLLAGDTMVETAAGQEITAMVDELSFHPRDGLGGKRVSS